MHQKHIDNFAPYGPSEIGLEMPPHNAVLETFQKFDKDGNGSISREELVEVLRTLDPDDWDDNSVDHLLASADANGDGALQIEEFVRWVFAEDVSKLGSASLGNSSLTILIEGSSRDDLNGEYVQQDEFYGHRPVFFNAEKGKYLFLQPETGWWFGSTLLFVLRFNHILEWWPGTTNMFSEGE